MGRVSLKQLGLKRAPSAYILFCKREAKTAVHDPPQRRLRKKVASKKMLHSKWHSLSDIEKKAFAKQASDLVLEIRAKKVFLASGQGEDVDSASDAGPEKRAKRVDADGPEKIEKRVEAVQDDIHVAQPGASDGEADSQEIVAGGGSFVHTLQQPASCAPCRDVIAWTSQQLLCTGAYGQVFKGTSKKTGLAYAVKVAGPELQKEYDVLKHINSPFVVSTFGFYSDGAQHILLLELWDGSVYNWMRKEDPPCDESRVHCCGQTLGPGVLSIFLSLLFFGIRK